MSTRKVHFKWIVMMLVVVLALSGCGSNNAKPSSSDKVQVSVPTDNTEKPESSSNTDASAIPGESVEPQKSEAPEASEAPKAETLGLHVDGTRVLDGKGNDFVMRGINHAHTWYKNEAYTALKAIAATGANTVRIVLSNGEQWTKDDILSVSDLINTCKELHMVAVLEVHDATGKNMVEDLEKAANYFIELKPILQGNEDYVIVNIANEWFGDWSSDLWTKGYTTVIPKIREAGIKNLIMVDSAGWGQYPKSIVDGGKEVFESDPLKNTMFSIHMYEYAGTNDKVIKANIDNVLNLDLAVCIGEFGFKHSSGDVDEEYILKYCNEIAVGYIGWSWKGNGGGVEYLDIANEWDGSVLSADWGEVLINSEFGIKNTSVVCSIFEE